jgi:hypothetical protein
MPFLLAGTALVVCPAGLLFRWRDELQAWAYFRVGIYHGARRDDVEANLATGRYELILTTYPALAKAASLKAFPWLLVVADQCHHLKSRKSAISLACNALACPRRIGLSDAAFGSEFRCVVRSLLRARTPGLPSFTGSCRLSELWPLVNWVKPGHLDDFGSFSQKFDAVLAEGLRLNAPAAAVDAARRASQELVQLLAPVFLRRCDRCGFDFFRVRVRGDRNPMLSMPLPPFLPGLHPAKCT